MKLKQIALKIYGNLYDMKWNNENEKYEKKECLFLKPSTIFFIYLIDIVQIIGCAILIILEKKTKGLLPLLICIASVLTMTFKTVLPKPKMGEIISLILFITGLLVTIYL